MWYAIMLLIAVILALRWALDQLDSIDPR